MWRDKLRTSTVRRFVLFYGEALAVRLGWLWIRLVYATSRWHFIGRDHLHTLLHPEPTHPIIICFWHGRMAMMPCAWQWKTPFVMLLSQHADGRLIARVLQFFGIGHVQGSSRRGGAEAFIKLCHLSTARNAIGITPDGPKGPAYSVAPGVVALARRTQAYIIPTSFSVKRAKRLQTWDNFLFPYPFNRGVFVADEPITPHALPDDDEAAAALVAAALNQAMHKADAWIEEN